MYKFRGFFKENLPRTDNNTPGHDAIAADIGMPLDSPCYAPWTEAGGIVKWEVIRVNEVDTSAKNVKFSAIKDLSHSLHQTFGYFHTDKSTLKVGQVITSGTELCKSAQNGEMYGAHVHLVGRKEDFKTPINPIDCMAIMNGGTNGILLGFPKIDPCTVYIARIKVLEAEVAKLNAQIVVLNAEKTAMGVVIASQAKKLADIKVIVG
jgi:hypothetical protein